MKKRKIGSKILANQFSTKWFEPKHKPEAPPGQRRPPGARGSGLMGSGNWGPLPHFIIFLARQTLVEARHACTIPIRTKRRGQLTFVSSGGRSAAQPAC